MRGFVLALALFASTMQCVTSCALTVCEDQKPPPCHHQSGTQAACTHEVVLDVAAPHFDLAMIDFPAPGVVFSAAPARVEFEVHASRGPAPPLFTLRV